MKVTKAEMRAIRALEKKGAQFLFPPEPHEYELRPCKGKNWRDSHWDDKKKVMVDDGPAKFRWCLIHDCWAWADAF